MPALAIMRLARRQGAQPPGTEDGRDPLNLGRRGMVHLRVRPTPRVCPGHPLLGQAHAPDQTVPELEIFDSGISPAARALVAEGAIKPPYSICFCLGFHWTLAPDPRSLFFMTSLMNETVPWGIVHDGMTDFTLLATAIGLGASLVRVGFEDSIFWAPGQAVKRNLELVQKPPTSSVCSVTRWRRPTRPERIWGTRRM